MTDFTEGFDQVVIILSRRFLFDFVFGSRAFFEMEIFILIKYKIDFLSGSMGRHFWRSCAGRQ